MSGAGVGGFGDARLGRVGALLLERVQERQTLCLHALADARTEMLRFGRFLDSDAVSAEEMLVQAGRQTARRAAGRHILAIQDTTELHFAGHAASKHGFGRADNGEDIGLFLHPTIAVDAAHGGVVGLVGATVLNRTAGKVAPRRQRTAEARESHRWLAGARSAEAVLEQAAMITVVADRESDIYDLFARRPARVHLLSRAAQDRGLAEGGRLFAHAAALPGQAHHVIAVPGRGARPARQAVVALRFGAVTLLRPATAARDLAERVVVHLVDVAEATPPPGEPALHWCLLTTHAVADVAAAQQVVGWYQARWTIEQVFRSLKSAALAAEESQVCEARRFIRLAVIGLIAAVRIVQIVLGRDGATGQPLNDAADPGNLPVLHALNAKLQGRTARLRNPHRPDSLAWFAWIVARLGGWSGYTSKGYKPAGPKTIARGLIRLDGRIEGWHLAHHSANV